MAPGAGGSSTAQPASSRAKGRARSTLATSHGPGNAANPALQFLPRGKIGLTNRGDNGVMAGKVLVLGHTGKLGAAVRAALAGGHVVTGASSAELDAANPAAVEALLAGVRPDAVVNCIALARVDACELDPVAAFRLNTLLPRLLAHAGRRDGFRLFHVSTGVVFSGTGPPGRPLTESDTPDPIHIYGLTKYMADLEVLRLGGTVVRTSVLFGEAGSGAQFLERMIAKARAGETPRVADDIVVSPTYAADVALFVNERVDGGAEQGLFHVVNAGAASLYELTVKALEYLGISARVEAASDAEFPAVAERPRRTAMASGRLPPLRTWQEALGEYCARLAADGPADQSTVR